MNARIHYPLFSGTWPAVIVAVVTSLLLVLSCPVPAQAGQSESARLEQVNRDIGKLKALLQRIREQRSAIAARLERAEKEISRLQSSLRTTKKELQAAEQTEQKQSSQRRKLQQEKSDRETSATQAVKAAYIAGRNPQLKMVLNQENLTRASRMLVYYDHFARRQSELIAALAESDRKLVLAEQNLSRTRQQIQQRRNVLKEKSQALSVSNKQRQQILASLKTKEARGSSQLGSLKREQQELQELLTSILSITDITDIDKPFRQKRGKMAWPVSGRVTHKYGEKRRESNVKWNGVFIRADSGTRVRAPHHGRVVFADWMKSFGQLLIIDHGDGYMTLYAHNQQLLKTEGDWVVPGEQVALVGNSGGQPDSGLYFEVRYQGRPSNPMTWLSASR